jgi:hypothetical protein
MPKKKRKRQRPGPRRGRGRPRTYEPGSKPLHTNLPPKIVAIVERLADEHKWSVSFMIAQLIEQALRTAGELK